MWTKKRHNELMKFLVCNRLIFDTNQSYTPEMRLHTEVENK